ncbi:unnamed protein product, partial [Callosobruchus maculatus]
VNCCVNPEPFTENVGADIPDNIENPVDIFLLLFSDQLLEKIVFETNLYATQKNLNIPHVSTTIEEVKCFMGLNILMGVKRLPSYKDYWSVQYEIRDHFIASCMSRNRFGWLLGNIHLNDNTLEPKKVDPKYDKLYKLRPMLDTLSETYAPFINRRDVKLLMNQ